MRRYMYYYLLYVLFVIIAAPKGLSAEVLSDDVTKSTLLIKKVIEVYGGQNIIDDTRSFHASGKIEALMRDDRGTYDLYFRRDRKLRVETKYRHASEVRILNGSRGYRSTDSDPLEEVFGPKYFSMLYQYKHVDILHELSVGAFDVRYDGKSIVNGSSVEVLKLKDKEGIMMDIFIDEKDYYILKVTGYFSADNKKMELSSELSDFRKVGNSVFPFQITNYAGGMKIARTTIEKYSINPELRDSLFEAPVIQSL
ncbi:MAG: hypothetical protein HQL08_11685 [Nitrospirae bacterium]|nr:hypothetical protein [Nitrospirota bacterium]